MNIGERLTEAMEQKGVSQNTLAHQAGVSQAYVSLICSGKKIPTIGTLTQIADCLGVSVGRLIAEEDAARSAPAPARLIPNEEEERIIRRYRTMSKRDKAVVCGVVEQLCDGR